MFSQALRRRLPSKRLSSAGAALAPRWKAALRGLQREQQLERVRTAQGASRSRRGAQGLSRDLRAHVAL